MRSEGSQESARTAANWGALPREIVLDGAVVWCYGIELYKY